MGEMTFFKKSKKETTIFSKKKKKKLLLPFPKLKDLLLSEQRLSPIQKKKNYRRNSHLNSVAEFYIHNSEIDLLPLE
jgi:hypothetical protein